MEVLERIPICRQCHKMLVIGKHFGLGGLGHVAVKFRKAFGLKVTVISISPNKEDEAVNHLGADGFLISSDLAKMQAAVGTMDYIIGKLAFGEMNGFLHIRRIIEVENS